MNTNVIEGNPTKKFFIEMITRDISIEDAIVDLLDNSIDGANRINSAIYDGLWITVEVFLWRQLKSMLLDLVGQRMPPKCEIIQ